MAVTPTERNFDVVVIGAGPAGTAAALRAAELGARVAVLEADRTGGTCVNTGCVPTRVLARTARITREMRTAGAWGIILTEQSLDWSETVDRVSAPSTGCARSKPKPTGSPQPVSS